MDKIENSTRVTNTITVINSFGALIHYNLWNETNNSWINPDYLPINFTESIGISQLKLKGVKSGDWIRLHFRTQEGKHDYGPALLFEDERIFSSAVLRLKRTIDNFKVSLIS
jgi:hypothetical protein